MLKDGWSYKIRDLYRDPSDVNNLGIGASTSAMGLFRYLAADNLDERAVIVWEYSLNEANFFASGQTLQSLRYNLEWLLETCIRDQRRFLPILLYNKREEEREAPNKYRKMLLNLFNRYNIDFIDGKKILRDVAGTEKPIFSDWYRDNAHYAVPTPFLSKLAEHIFNAIPTAKVPRRQEDANSPFSGKMLRLVRPIGTEPILFQNRVVKCNFYSLSQDLRAPVYGRLLACLLITSPNAETLTIIHGPQKNGPYSTQVYKNPDGPHYVLKHIIPWDLPRNMPSFWGEISLSGRRSNLNNSLKPIVQNTFTWQGINSSTREDGIVYLLTEEAEGRTS